VKIRSVRADPRRRAFAVGISRGVLEFPWTEVDPVPSAADPVVEVAPDPELGREGFTFRLASGAEGTVHIDHVLRFVRDPDYQRRELLYALTNEVRDALAASRRTKRSVARQMGTSLAQVARLLDPADSRKSVDQMVRLLAALGRRLEVHVEALVAPEARRGRAAERGPEGGPTRASRKAP
jgi:hypothetical protein